MEDNEIIKALEVCVRIHNDCDNCPLLEYSQATDECMTEAMSNALNLINRQKAEIERLNSPYEMQVEASKKLENSIKAEAVKEFATDIINNILPKYMQGHSEQALKISLAISERVKEMVGEN